MFSQVSAHMGYPGQDTCPKGGLPLVRSLSRGGTPWPGLYLGYPCPLDKIWLDRSWSDRNLTGQGYPPPPTELRCGKYASCSCTIFNKGLLCFSAMFRLRRVVRALVNWRKKKVTGRRQNSWPINFSLFNSILTTRRKITWPFVGTPFITITKLLLLFKETPLEAYHAGNTQVEGDTALPNSASFWPETIQKKNHCAECGDTWSFVSAQQSSRFILFRIKLNSSSQIVPNIKALDMF